MSLAVAKQYARALYDALEPMDSERARAVVNELEAVQGLLDVSPELRGILLNPAVTPQQKKGLIGRLGEQAGISLTRNFLLVVIDRRRIGLFSEIREAFEAIIADEAGITQAQVTLAADATDQQRSGLEAALAELTASTVRCRYGTDDSLIGGAVVKIGSTVYDGSIRGQLEALRRRLTT